MKRKIIWVGAAVVVILVVVIFNQSNSQDNGVIKIGSIEPLTGFAAFLGEASKAGAELAVEDLQNEGLDIEVIFEDSEGKPDKSASVAHKLISSDGVDAIFTNLSGPSSAVSPIANEKEVLFSYSAFDPANLESNPYAFKTFLNAVEECQIASKYAKDSGVQKIAYLGVNLSFTQACVDEMVGVFGEDNVLIEAAASPGETDFRSSLQKLKVNGVGFAITYGYELNYESILSQNIDTGANIPLICVESDCYSDKISKSTPLSLLNGYILYDYNPSDKFIERIREKYGETINVRIAGLAYDMIHYLAYAIDECSGDLDCMVDHISNNKEYKTVSPSPGFNGDRSFDLNNEYFLIQNGRKTPLNLN